MEILKIGVTGSAGSGKSLVLKGFAQMGLEVFDCDRIAREVVAPGQPAHARIVEIFGPEVLGPDQNLDRRRMRQVILDHPEKRLALEGVLHPAIITEMVCQMESAPYNKEKACAVEVPLLFELNMESYFDVTLVVVADLQQLEERIVARDKVERTNAQKILSLQMPQAEKARRADHVIENRGDARDLLRRLEILYKGLKKERLTKSG